MSEDAGSPLVASASCTSATIVSDCSCLTERLTLIVSGTRTGEPGVHDRAVAAGHLQHPAADRDDQAALLGEWDELVGRDVAARRVRPPQQRLDAVDLVLLQADDRLVVDRELVQRDRLLQVRAQLQPLEHALVHRRLEDPVAALAVALRHVHGDIGVAEQLLGVGRRAARLDEADADAGAWEHLLAVDLELCLEGAQQPGGRVGSVREVGDAVEEDGELVAAEACDRVGRPDRGAETGCDLPQDAVAGRVAEAVVDGLELVEVDEHDRDRRSGALGAGERMLDTIREERPVGEVRHGVVEGLVGELLLEHLALADVAAVQDDSAHVLVGEQVRVLDLELEPRTVAMLQRAARSRAPRSPRERRP